MRVLLVDDDVRFTGVLSASLGALGYDVTTSAPEAATGRVGGSRYDLVVVDVDGEAGRTFLAELARQAPDVKVIVLTSALTVETSVEYLRGGAAAAAVDCIGKPVVDLARRIDDTARRYVGVIKRGLFTADVVARCGYYDGRDLSLTPSEFTLYLAFMERPYEYLPYDELGMAFYGRETSYEDAYNALRSPLSRLRTKLREAVGRNVLSRHEDDGIRFMPGGTGARWKDTSKRAPMPQS